jgi:hypothetical protein
VTFVIVRRFNIVPSKALSDTSLKSCTLDNYFCRENGG